MIDNGSSLLLRHGKFWRLMSKASASASSLLSLHVEFTQLMTWTPTWRAEKEGHSWRFCFGARVTRRRRPTGVVAMTGKTAAWKRWREFAFLAKFESLSLLYLAVLVVTEDPEPNLTGFWGNKPAFIVTSLLSLNMALLLTQVGRLGEACQVGKAYGYHWGRLNEETGVLKDSWEEISKE